ncbi:MAG: hypothetical protein EAZ24_05090, partial [Burkholderiales bacterium]
MFDSVFQSVLSFAQSGTFDLPWWGLVLVTLGCTHITIAAVTIFLHRAQAHRALDLHPIVSHFFRAWLWLTTGMVTKEWVAIHRKHHAKCETVDDPHSPVVHGHWNVLRFGVDMYRNEAKNADTMQRYGYGTPDDWIERNVYARYTWQGMAVSLFIYVALFGVLGLSMWCIQLIWIPVTAAGIINGTTNFILSEMRDKGLDFDVVLKEAQRLGYAEADPTFDIEGVDAAHKVTLMSAIAFGIPVQFDKAYVEGITKLGAADIKYAEQ